MIEQGVEVDREGWGSGGTGVLRDVRAPFQLPIAPSSVSPGPRWLVVLYLSFSLFLSLWPPLPPVGINRLGNYVISR